MESLFTAITVLLAAEYIDMFTPESLLSKLSKVRAVTGVQFSKAKKTYALTGSWEQVNTAFELLQKWYDSPSDEPNDDHQNIAFVADDEKGESSSIKITDRSNEALNKHCQEKDNEEMLKQVMLEVGAVKNGSSSIEDVVEYLEKQVEDIKGKHIKCKQKSRDKEEKGRHRSTRKKIQFAKNSPKPTQIETKLNISETPKLFECSSTPEYGDKSVKSQTSSLKIVVIGDCENTENEAPKLMDEISRHSPKICNKIKNALNSSIQKLKINNGNRSHSRGKNTSLDKTCAEEASQANIAMSGGATNEPCTETNKAVKNPHSKKNQRKPGDNGYWSRVKIADYNEKHKCSQCDVVLKSRKRLMEHMRRIHIKGLKCDVCERRFGYPTDLNRHKCPGVSDPSNELKGKSGIPKKVKVEQPVFLPCPDCDYIGTSRKRFNGHVKRSHMTTFACDQCDKRFGFERDLHRHKENVHSEMTYFCDKCSKFYKSKAVFSLHVKTHEQGYLKPKHDCPVCQKSFTTKYVLSAHVKTEHLGMKKTYLCQICGKKFSQRNSYKQHSNAHAGIKPYVCDLCGKAFTYHKSLKEHKFMHDNIRRFQCTLCDKAFRQRTTLQIHMKVHKTVKDHICGTCNKGFSQKQALERHERIHTGIKPYTCVPCQRLFGDASTIRRHMISIHQKTENNWREDIICTVKKKTDYYVQGGSGQNRTYNIKSEASQTTNTTNLDDIKQTQSRNGASVNMIDSDVNKPKELEDHTVDDISTGHNKMDLSYCNALSEIGDHVQGLQPTAVLNISQGTNVQQLNSASVISMNYTPAHVLDFTNMSQAFTQQQQLGSEKNDVINGASQHVISDQAQLASQTNNVFQAATLVPIGSLTDVPRSGQGTGSQQVPGEAALNQAMTSFWGLVGYPTYYNSASLTQFQNPPNQ